MTYASRTDWPFVTLIFAYYLRNIWLSPSLPFSLYKRKPILIYHWLPLFPFNQPRRLLFIPLPFLVLPISLLLDVEGVPGDPFSLSLVSFTTLYADADADHDRQFLASPPPPFLFFDPARGQAAANPPPCHPATPHAAHALRCR